MIRRGAGVRARLIAVALVCAASVVPLSLPPSASAASAADAPVRLPRWTRPLAPEAPYRPAGVLVPLPDGSMLVRNGEGFFATDARGVTRWSMPNVTDAIADGSAVVFRRSNVLFAVRGRDAGVLWKRPCVDAPYVVPVADRIATICGGISTVLRASDGSVLAHHAVKISTAPANIRAARRLNDRYVLVTNFFDGAWMGESYYVVDARTGAFLWWLTDTDFLDADATTVVVSPYPSMLPWEAVGTVQRRRLSDGVVVSTEHYATPKSEDSTVRGFVTMSQAATYVHNMETGLYRFRRGETRDPQGLLNGARVTASPLGSAAFIFIDQMQPPGRGAPFYLDRPSTRGTFSTSVIGRVSGDVSGNTDAGRRASEHAVDLGDRLAVADNGVIRLYDEFGRIEMSAKSPCDLPQVAATRTMLFMRCTLPRSPRTLAGFARP